MKTIFLIICILTSMSLFAMDDVKLGLRPVIGVGVTENGGYAIVKTYLLELGKSEDFLTASFLGAGIAVGKEKGLMITPFIFKYKNIGLGLDFNMNKNKNSAGPTLSYSF